MRTALTYFFIGWLDWLREQRQAPARELLPNRTDAPRWGRRLIAAALALGVLMLAGKPLGVMVGALPADTLERVSVMPALATVSALSVLLVAWLGARWSWRQGRRLVMFCREMHERGRAIVLARQAVATEAAR